MARPKTAGERNEQLMMDKVTEGEQKQNMSLRRALYSGQEAAGEDPRPRGEAPVLLSVQGS